MFGGLRPSMVVMDLALPDLTGMDLAEGAPFGGQTRDVPIVAVTASGMVFGEAARSAGCDGFVRKPLDTETFAGMVAGHLRGRSKRRSGATLVPMPRSRARTR